MELEVDKVSENTKSLNFSLTKVDLEKSENKFMNKSNGWLSGPDALQASLDYSLSVKKRLERKDSFEKEFDDLDERDDLSDSMRPAEPLIFG